MATVYILGAGFSKPLGGPMLADLFDATQYDLAINRFPDLQNDPTAYWANSLYRNIPPGSNRLANVSLWNDAEEFLEQLELLARAGMSHPKASRVFDVTEPYYKSAMNEAIASAAKKYHNSATQQEVITLLPSQLQTTVNADFPYRMDDTWDAKFRKWARGNAKPLFKCVLTGAKRLIAAQCSAFFDSSDVHFDKWSPYREWMTRLKRTDTVVTFNYDLVLETICEVLKLGDTVNVVLPQDGLVTSHANVLKLHGSVDWEWDGSTATPSTIEAPYAIHGDDQRMLLGTPGPNKLDGANGPLNRLWKVARQSIERAEHIVFLGYRMPPTDAYARKFLREAIQNKVASETKNSDENDLRITIVLGPPELSANHATRLKRVLCAMTRPRDVVNWLPLGTEDYLDLEQGLLKADHRQELGHQ